ncbi:MAG: pitrilysin family protein [Candidatus Nanopelagicales bacterium]|nr:pitrilysin family protein [Candidatus Nanopelagicales bacterium]
MARAHTSTLLREDDGSIVRRTVLPGGLRIITQHVPGVRSAAFGVWVTAGSRDETPAQHGSAHFLEHLLFKGTSRRTALEISSMVEAVGGDLNAFTGKELTCYHAKVIDRDLPMAIDVVCDVVTDALLRASDIEDERGVILEEIAMYEDDPSDLVHDEFASLVYGDTPLGRPILGTTDSIGALNRATIRSFYRKHYQPSGMVVSAAGNVDHDDVVRRVRRAFAPYLDPAAEPKPLRTATRAPRMSTGTRLSSRPTEQANLVLGVPGLARGDDRRYALAVLTTALGGGMSSRLFQEVREKRGLAYSVYAFSQGFTDSGMVGLYAGCLPAKVATVLEVFQEQIHEVVTRGLTPDEVARGKGQVRGATVLGQEDTGARMNRIAKAELQGEDLMSIDQLLARVDEVSTADVHDVARDLLAAPASLAVIGPFADADTFASSR